MKLSILVFVATMLGATAAIDHPGLDLERRELDLERRELEFEHKARAWMATRDAQDALNPRATCSGYCGYPTMPRCSAGCICQRGSCVAMGLPSPPPSPQGKKGGKGGKGGRKRST